MSAAPTLDVSVMFHPDRAIGETAELAAEVERLGLAGVWLGDSQSIFRDVFTALTLVAERTSRIALGVGVTNTVSRHPAVIAGAIGSVAEHAAGRTVLLGIGTGETAVESLGRKPATIARMEEVARAVRGLNAGETVTYEGAEITQDWPAPRVPIVFASTGPRSLRAAGRTADGVYLKLGVDPDVLRYAVSNLAAGRAEGGRTLDGFRVAAMVPVAVDDDPAVARDEVRGFAAAIARAAARAIPPEDLPQEIAATIAELERVSSVARGRQSYVQWLHSPEYARMIPDAIVDRFAIAGTAAQVAGRIAGLGAAGVTEVIAPLAMPDPRPALGRIGAGVMPLLAATHPGGRRA
ncbi:LLM class flavin-dependent oxidoreductase [Capillimicrobium parvum]|uniref:F420-dependent glucose-6-phosphate dehydrogenase n=1 Tax=Capillimicrobium parvum TaxID=2884022 RepID=A0A9E6XVS0_9ACTN|nr:LLM class flavin-dependent oxidoreductase [Capillimicrobium parvum]UGS35328.1 F420-dependent glucose-6-phosphate dehydrogenase [Capillimicrobium parvum]